MTWFKVDDSFHSHPKVLATSPAALGLWVVAGSWSSSVPTDGFVPDHVLPRLLEDAERLARELAAVGLWRRTKGGYRFHDWTDFNPRAEEVQADRQAARERMRKLRANRKAAGQADDCSGEHGANVRDLFATPTRPDPNHKEQPPNPPPAKPARRGRPTDDPNFDRFWSAYPKKADKGHALDMWKRHVVTGDADPEVVIAGAQRYRDDPRRKPDYTKNAGTWLNGLCWLDQPAEQRASSAAWWEN